MNTRTATTIRIAALAVGLLSLTAATANAAQDAGPMVQAAATSVRVVPSSTSCPLTRIGAEYVRCDDLTGNGVAAPAWIPTGSVGVTDLGAVALASEATASATGSPGGWSGRDSLEWRRHGI